MRASSSTSFRLYTYFNKRWVSITVFPSFIWNFTTIRCSITTYQFSDRKRWSHTNEGNKLICLQTPERRDHTPQLSRSYNFGVCVVRLNWDHSHYFIAIPRTSYSAIVWLTISCVVSMKCMKFLYSWKLPPSISTIFSIANVFLRRLDEAVIETFIN